MRIFNTFFGGIYTANKHRGHERALSDAALVTAIWIAFVLMTAFLCVLAAFGRFSTELSGVQKPAFVAALLVVVALSWTAIRRLGDRPLSGPRIDLNTFLKKRAFGIGCVVFPLVLVLAARTLTTGSLL